MKHTSLRTLALLFSLALLAGCTLMLEEYDAVPEEEQGFDEPVTVENELGSFTYQYNDGVLPVTRTIQEYITRVEDDSIIYFSSDIPGKWLPVKGGYLSAVCTRTLPEGLNHRVLTVDKVGGEYRVKTTAATRDEVFKEFKVKLELDYQAPAREVYDSLTLDSLGIDIDELTEYDFSVVDEAYGDTLADRPRMARVRHDERVERLLPTRAAEKTNDGHDTTMNFPLSFSFKLKKSTLTVTGNYKHVTKEHIYYEEDKNANYRKSYTDDQSETVIELKASFDFTKDIVGGSTKTPIAPDKTYEIWQKIKEITDDKELPDKDKKLKIANVKVPLPVAGLCLVIKFDGTISFSGSIYGNAKITYHHAQTRNGYVYSKGKKTNIEETIKDAYTTLDDLYIGGSATITGGVRAAVGVEIVGTGLGADIGLTLQAGLELSAKGNILSAKTRLDEENNYIRAFIEFIADAEVYWSPLGVQLAGFKYELYNKTIFEEKSHTNPVVVSSKSKGTFGVTTVKDYDDEHNLYDRRVMNYTKKVCFSKLWTFNNMFHAEYTYPRVRVYYSGVDGPYHDFVTTGGHNTNGELTATPNQQYTFTFTSDDLHNIFALTTGNYEAEKSQFVVVPCLYDALDDVTTEFRKYSTTYGQSKPKVTYDKYGQVSGMSVRKLIETEGGEEGTEEYEAYKSGIEKRYGKFDLDSWYFYQFWFQLDFENAPYVDKWGFQVEILKDNYKSHVLMETEVEVNHNLYGTMRSGKRKVLCEFISNYKTIEKGGDCMQVRIRPYTINVLGERTDHAWTGYKDIYFNVNKDFDMNGEWDEVSINGH